MSHASSPAGPDAFDHVVITRFSAVFAEGMPPADDMWLRSRLELFERVCLPSVSAQTVPLTWVVFCDDRGPSWFHARVEELAAARAFVPVWTHEPFARACPRAVERHTSREYLITTRLDSDDAIADDYAARIQAEFDAQPLLYLSFPHGLQADPDGAVYRYRYPSGPFISLIEARTTDVLRTVFHPAQHRRARAHGPLREVQSPPVWLQLVHGANIANDIRGVRVHPRALDRFTIALGEPPRPSPGVLAGQRFGSLARRTRLWAEQPYYLAQWVDTLADHARGSHTKPRTDDPRPRLVTAARKIRRLRPDSCHLMRDRPSRSTFRPFFGVLVG